MTGKNQTRHRLAAIWFCMLLSAPLLGHLVGGGNDLSLIERRSLAAAPSLAMLSTNPATFPAGVNDWLNDRFGFRRQLIRLDIYLRDKFDLADARLAIRGDDGWLFGNLENSLAMHQGLFPFTAKEKEAWLSAVSEIRNAACGAPFVVLIAPNKHTIYPEYLAGYPRRIAERTRLETLEREAETSDVEIVSARAALLEAKSRGQVYYKTDTHWTAYGAFAAYQQIMAAFTRQEMELETVTADRLVKAGDRRHAGDLYGLLGVERGAAETIAKWSVANPTPIATKQLLPEFHWGEFDAERTTMKGAEKPILLILGDSFANGLTPYLRESFGEITFVHHQNVEPPLEILSDCRFDAVMLQMVERTLTHEIVLGVRAAGEKVGPSTGSG